MDLKKRIEEITQNGTLESGEQITYVDTDDLYLLLNEVISSEVIHSVSPCITLIQKWEEDGESKTGWSTWGWEYENGKIFDEGCYELEEVLDEDKH